MAKEPRLVKQGRRWTFRARVPADLQAALGKREIWKSLGDVSHAEAVRLVRKESVRVDELFAVTRERLKPAPTVELTDSQLEQVARSVLHQLEAAAPPVPFDEQEREERHAAALEEAGLIGQSTEDAGLQRVSIAVSQKEGLPVAENSRTFPRLVEAVQRAFVEHYLRDADRTALVSERVSDPLFEGVKMGGPAPVRLLTLSRAIELYLGDVERAHLAPKTLASYKAKLGTIAELIGPERPISEIVRETVKDARDTLLKLPPNATKHFPGVPLRKVVEMATADKLPAMSPKSAALYTECLSGLFRWLVREELARHNPAEGLKGPKLDEETDRRPFTVEELNTLFAAPVFAGRKTKGWMYWLPRVALFTGARFAELLGLQAADVVEKEGVWLFRIAPNEGRRIKTSTSRRLVPIHPELVRLGFLEYTAGLRKDGLLFPDAAGPRNMLTAQNKKIGRALRAIISDKDVVFHSIRHTWKDAADAVMPRETAFALGGWGMPGGKSAGDSYGRAKHAARLAAEMAKVRFEGLEL